MTRLIFLVARAGVIDVGQAVERQLTVALESRGLIDQRTVAIQLLVILVSGLDAHRIDQPAAASDELQSGIHQRLPRAAMQPLMKIPYRP